MNFVVTAGYDKSKPALALCEQIRKSGHRVAGVIVVTPFSVKRLRGMLLQRGSSGVKLAFAKLLPGAVSHQRDDYESYLKTCGVNDRSLSGWCARLDIPMASVSDINAQQSIQFVQSVNAHGLVYAGGGIIRRELINAANGVVINPHIGPLPEVRGMNAIEWALLLGHPLDVTVHFIDEGIDTGNIISRVAVPLRAGMDLGALRASAVTTAIDEIANVLNEAKSVEAIPRAAQPAATLERQCYVMAPALRELAERRLAKLLAPRQV